MAKVEFGGELLVTYKFGTLMIFHMCYRKSWLQNVGSPQSRIDKAVFTTEAILKEKPTGSFSIRR